jgi:GT2 family glycosyltransferase
MQLSFIIPLYNCLALTQATLANLVATVPSGSSYEIIFVDDGSTDGTRVWLTALGSPVRVILNDRNLGYAGANNRGVASARGDLLVLLNNDLNFERGWLEPMLAVHRKMGRRAGVVGNVQRSFDTGAVDHAGIFINLKAKPEHDHSLAPRWLRYIQNTRMVPAVTGACALVERTLWNQLGGFDEGFVNGGEDVDFCLRVRATGRTNTVALRSVIRHHVSSSPGRKLRDEENSRRLALRWRRELEYLALHRWCWDFLVREWTTPRTGEGHADACGALLYAMRLRRHPPGIALLGMRAAMEREFLRWAAILK